MAVTGVLLALLMAPQFLDAFAVERANLRIDPESVKQGFGDYPPVVGSALSFLLLLMVLDFGVQRTIKGSIRPPSRTEFSAVLKNLSLVRAAKGIDQRLWAGGFQPAGPNPDPDSPKIVAVRPVRLWKFDSYEAPSLRIELILQHHAEGTKVQAILETGKIVAKLAVDTGEGEYYRALLEHLVTGGPMLRIGDLGPSSFCCMLSAWTLALLMIGRQFGWNSYTDTILLVTAACSGILLLFSLVERLFRRNIVGSDLSCAFSLLMVCGAILIRACL